MKHFFNLEKHFCMNSNNYLNRLSRLTKNALVKGKQASEKILHDGKKKKEKIAKNLAVPLTDRVQESVQLIDNALGVSVVTEAQENVSAKETDFLNARSVVEKFRAVVADKQEELNKSRKILDRTDRADEKYLVCVAEEHRKLLEVQKLRRDYESAESTERQQFIAYSAAVRLSHEKERTRVERTKYWSIIASVSGTVLGFLLSSLVTQYRLNCIKDVTKTSIEDTSDKLQARLIEHRNSILQETKSLKNILLADAMNTHEENSLMESKIPVNNKNKRRSESIIQEFDKVLSHYEEIQQDILTSTKSLKDIVLKTNSQKFEQIEDLIKRQNKNIDLKLQKILTGSTKTNELSTGKTNEIDNCETRSVPSLLNVNNINLVLGLSTLIAIVYSSFGRS